MARGKAKEVIEEKPIEVPTHTEVELADAYSNSSSIIMKHQIIDFTDGSSLEYDFLVVATGVTTNYFNTPGAAENTMAIYTRQQALTLRDKIFTQLEHAAAESADSDSHEVTAVVVGGGATGAVLLDHLDGCGHGVCCACGS